MHQNYEKGTKLADPISMEDAMDQHRKEREMFGKHPARDVNVDWEFIHTKWSYTTETEE